METIIFYLFAPIAVGLAIFSAIYLAGLVVIEFWQWFQSAPNSRKNDES